jgi:hypothetical protein
VTEAEDHHKRAFVSRRSMCCTRCSPPALRCPCAQAELAGLLRAVRFGIGFAGRSLVGRPPTRLPALSSVGLPVASVRTVPRLFTPPSRSIGQRMSAAAAASATATPAAAPAAAASSAVDVKAHVAPPSASAAGLNAFLTASRAQWLSLCGPGSDPARALTALGPDARVHIVMGNEAGDLDSVVCAVVYAYFKALTERAKGHVWIPLINIPRKHMPLRDGNMAIHTTQHAVHRAALHCTG